jgi:hypothetical protein
MPMSTLEDVIRRYKAKIGLIAPRGEFVHSLQLGDKVKVKPDFAHDAGLEHPELPLLVLGLGTDDAGFVPQAVLGNYMELVRVNENLFEPI